MWYEPGDFACARGHCCIFSGVWESQLLPLSGLSEQSENFIRCAQQNEKGGGVSAWVRYGKRRRRMKENGEEKTTTEWDNELEEELGDPKPSKTKERFNGTEKEENGAQDGSSKHMSEKEMEIWWDRVWEQNRVIRSPRAISVSPLPTSRLLPGVSSSLQQKDPARHMKEGAKGQSEGRRWGMTGT